MIIKVSDDAGLEGEIAVLTFLTGVGVEINDPRLTGPTFDVLLIGADYQAGFDGYGPDVYGHPYDVEKRQYLYDEAVTFTLSEKAVVTYL